MSGGWSLCVSISLHLPSPNVSSPRRQLLDIARGLKYMHGLGMVHGNLKIVNLILAHRLRSHTHALLD